MKNIMTNELISLMYQLTKLIKIKKMRGILLCKDKSGMIVASNVSIGNEFELPSSEIKKMKCQENTMEVETFRSYPTE